MKLVFEEKFIDANFCQKIILQHKEKTASKVLNREGIYAIKNEVRKSVHLEITEDDTSQITDLLLSLIPSLNQKFATQVTDLSVIDILKYKEGHFFKKHIDNIITKKNQQRTLTALIYLNSSTKYGQNDEENAFEGGELIIYGLHEKFPAKGFTVYPKTARLVIFPSSLVHEVTPIIKGNRYCIVAWYLK